MTQTTLFGALKEPSLKQEPIDDDGLQDEEEDYEDSDDYENETEEPITVKTKKYPMKIEIHITSGHHYDKSTNNGAEFTSVNFNAPKYGGSEPCDNEEEVQRSIEQAKETIIHEGDIPVV